MTERIDSVTADDEIDLRALAHRVWRFRWPIAAVTCAAPIVAAFLISARPEYYESNATVVVTPNALVASLNPAVPLAFGPMSMEAYERLATAEPVRKVLRLKLEKAGIPTSLIDVPGTLKAAREDQVPWINLTVTATSSQRAQVIANAWVDALIEIDALAGEERKRKGIEGIIKDHPKVALEVKSAEEQLSAMRNRHLRASAQAEIGLGEAQKSAELTARRQRVLAIEEAVANTKASIEEAKARIEQLELELKGTAERLSGDARSADVGRSEPAAGRSNAVLDSLTEQLARERSNYRGQQARHAVLQSQLQDAIGAVDRAGREVVNAKLTLARLSAEQLREAEAVGRAAKDARERFTILDQRYAEALAAVDAPKTYLKRGPPASVPHQPQPRSYTPAVLVIPAALLVSVACALVAALLLESRLSRATR